MSLREARERQKEIQTKVIIKISLYTASILAFVFCIHFFTDLFGLYPALYALPVVLFLFALKNSRALEFLQPKEFIGTVKYCNIALEPQKKYASGQAGVGYDSYDVPMMQIIAINSQGRKYARDFQCRGNFGEFKEGDRIAVLRFIEIPLIP